MKPEPHSDWDNPLPLIQKSPGVNGVDHTSPTILSLPLPKYIYDSKKHTQIKARRVNLQTLGSDAKLGHSLLSWQFFFGVFYLL